MAETTGQEVQQGINSGIRAGAKAARAAKSVQKAAANAAAGNVAGAAVELFKNGTVRRGLVVILLASFLLTIIVFFIVPLAIYETIVKIVNEIVDQWNDSIERFKVGYYSGTSGRVGGLIKGIWAWMGGNSEITNEVAEDELDVMSGEEELRTTYIRKIKACQDKIYDREQEVLNEISGYTIAGQVGLTRDLSDIASIMQYRFDTEEAHRYDDDDYVRIEFDGTEIAAVARSVTPRQAIQLLSLYSTQINGSISNIKYSGLLKWLGYNDGGQKLSFPLGDNRDLTYKLTSWSGTFLPQYLIDEAESLESRVIEEQELDVESIGALEYYQEHYGASVADFIIRVDCPNLYALQAIESEEIVTETQTYYTDLVYFYKDYDVPKFDKPIYDSKGNILIMQGPYHYEWSDVYQRYLAVRNADAPEATFTWRHFIYTVEQERTVDIRVIHIKYIVPIQVTTRSVEEIVEMTGMWSGWLPSDPVYELAQAGKQEKRSALKGIPAATSFVAYTRDIESTVAGFAYAFDWDLNKIEAASWEGLDGETYERPNGHQAEAYEESVHDAEQLCIDLGIIGPLSDYGSGGLCIAAVAKAEVNAPDSFEIPYGSNNVKYNTWRYGHPVSGDQYMWCANFVSWCANKCGYLGRGLFNQAESVRGVFNYQTQENGFDYYTGADIKQLGGDEYYAVPGDLFCFQFSHIGIVTAVTDNSIEITQGNTDNRVQSIIYTANDLSNPLVSSGFIIHVEYPANEYTMFNFLVNEMELPGAAAVGILANMWEDSHWNPNAEGANGTSYGLCQWQGERIDNLKSFCATNGYDWESIEGQLRYLKFELETRPTYAAMLARLRQCSDDPEGAAQAAYDFCATYESISNKAEHASQRSYLAQTVFYPMFMEGDESAFLRICGDYRNSSLSSSSYSSKVTPQQQAIVDAAYAILDDPYLLYGYYPNGNKNARGTGYYIGCAGFIQGVYKYAGQNGGSGNAVDYWYRYNSAGGTSKTAIPIGACLVTDAHAGNPYGHIGIYVGNGKVIHFSSKVQESTLAQFMRFDGRYLGWVWPANIVLGTATD